MDAAQSKDEAERLAAAIDPAVAQAHARPDRLVKLTAAEGGRVAVAYWGGTLRIADDSGKILSEQQLPQDATALTWIGGQAVAGLADGRVVAFKPPQ